eukprot:COSAG03_NODE_1105_length_4804_cov_14.592561_5_plen_62_part_00
MCPLHQALAVAASRAVVESSSICCTRVSGANLAAALLGLCAATITVAAPSATVWLALKSWF